MASVDTGYASIDKKHLFCYNTLIASSVDFAPEGATLTSFTPSRKRYNMDTPKSERKLTVPDVAVIAAIVFVAFSASFGWWGLSLIINALMSFINHL